MSEGNGDKSENCCISHKFVEAASKNHHKIAVIQASALAPTIRSEAAQSSSDYPPVYEGDKCFTFSKLSSSIDSLTSRLNRILNDSRETGPDVYMPKVLALYMPPSVEYIISVFSVLRCGEACFRMAFLLSLLLSFSYQSKIIEVRNCNGGIEGKCPRSPTPSPSMINSVEGDNQDFVSTYSMRNRCHCKPHPPNPSPLTINSSEEVNQECVSTCSEEHKHHVKHLHHKDRYSKPKSPSPSPSVEFY